MIEYSVRISFHYKDFDIEATTTVQAPSLMRAAELGCNKIQNIFIGASYVFVKDVHEIE